MDLCYVMYDIDVFSETEIETVPSLVPNPKSKSKLKFTFGLTVPTRQSIYNFH
jgi:hypothetical protein